MKRYLHKIRSEFIRFLVCQMENILYNSLWLKEAKVILCNTSYGTEDRF